MQQFANVLHAFVPVSDDEIVIAFTQQRGDTQRTIVASVQYHACEHRVEIDVCLVEGEADLDEHLLEAVGLLFMECFKREVCYPVSIADLRKYHDLASKGWIGSVA